jgi:transposase
VLRKAGLSCEADPENYLGGSSQTMYFIGLDIHKKTISYCVKDAAGRVHQEGKIGSSRLALDNWIRALPQPRAIAMEATIFTGWIYDHLLPPFRDGEGGAYSDAPRHCRSQEEERHD